MPHVRHCLQMRSTVISVMGVAAVTVSIAALAMWGAARKPVSLPQVPHTASVAPQRVVRPALMGLDNPDTAVPSRSPRWGRVTASSDPERWPPNRSDWSDDPAHWPLLPIATVRGIPEGIKASLESLDCAVPAPAGTGLRNSVIHGHFETPGVLDLAVLCVHTDQSSATYIFWAEDPARRGTLPQSGNSISLVRRAAVERRLDPDAPVDRDMPRRATRDAIEVGCCECCSTLFYYHRGQWFTLPGAD